MIGHLNLEKFVLWAVDSTQKFLTFPPKYFILLPKNKFWQHAMHAFLVQFFKENNNQLTFCPHSPFWLLFKTYDKKLQNTLRSEGPSTSCCCCEIQLSRKEVKYWEEKKFERYYIAERHKTFFWSRLGNIFNCGQKLRRLVAISSKGVTFTKGNLR